MTRSTLNLVLLVSSCSLLTLVAGQSFNLRESPGPSRQVEVFVNVYDHPKTGFTCAGKAPGQYYADPETKCAVYYVCIPNPNGALSPQSFACPNGTIFSQATRVCRPHEEVFCNLATRYYDNPQGQIDTKGEFDALPLPVPVPIQPAVPSRRQSAPRREAKPTPQPAVLAPAPAPQPVAHQPKAAPTSAPNSNLFNSNSRFRNSRIVSPSTTSTTTSAPLPAAGPGLGDYEYDYGDYGNETGLANAASSLHAQIIENIAEAIAKESKEAQITKTTGSSEATAESAVSRRKRESEPWMLSRRKGQLIEAINDLVAEGVQSSAGPTAFTCEDKIAGVAYSDIASSPSCSKFYVCVTVAKGKLWSYHLNCDAGKRFNQALGMCDTNVTDKTCARSERFYAYNKWHKTSKKHLLESAKKLSAQQ